jgi:asparagine synthase (glutamine-hydrolysing)
MCGICGFNWNNAELIVSMTDEITHRGPDQSGTYTSEGVSLGHRRLSILDLTEQGRQPMRNEDGSVQLSFNGEIYNYESLRDELSDLGHVFSSKADSEVIIHAYEEYGAGCLDKLRGMFAFAVWDAREKILFVARDRIGIKPLYYYCKNGKFIFASEIKSILKDPSVERRLNHQALYDYMGFEFVPAPSTMFRDVNKLPAGHYMIVKDGHAEVKRFWDLTFQPSDISYDDAVEQQRELLDFAVKSHLKSDVPLGVLLSGGLDSSTLVALMRRHISGPLKTFTIGYEDASFSEVEYAQQVAEQFETEHHVLTIDDTLSPDYVETALWHLDEPMTDLSSVPLYLVCKKVKEFATVCLSGEGGDEIYAGYDRFRASRLDRMYSSIVPSFLRHGLVSPIARRLPDQPQKKGPINMIKRFIEGSDHSRDAAHLRWQYFLNNSMSEYLFNDDFKSRVQFDPFRQVREHAARCNATDVVNREIYLDTKFMMPDSVLMKVDKMSMANALEIRVPFLDHKVVEFNATLRGDWKLKGLTTKHILRAALEGLLPDNIVNRGKQGYSLPVKHLLRGSLKDYMIGLLNESPGIKANVNLDHVNKLIEEHSEMKHNHNHVLWGLINTAIWFNRFNVDS